MKNKHKYLFPALSFLLLFTACGEKIKKAEIVYSEEDVAIEVGRGVEILYSDSAIVRVRVQAPLLHNYSDLQENRQEFPEGITADFFGSDGKATSRITAKTATRFFKKQIIVVQDSVVVTTVKNERLETEELTWDERGQKLTTEKFVKVSRPDEVLYGYGLDANQDFTYWKIKAPTGRIKAADLNEN